MTNELVLYKDRSLKQPFKIEDLGDTEAGDIKKMDGYLYNTTPDVIKNIHYETLDPDVHILEVPTVLEGENWAKVDVTYTPDKLRTSALNTFVTFKGKRRTPPE